MNFTLKIASVNLNSTTTTINQNLLRDFIWNQDIDLVFVQELCYQNFSFIPSHFAIINLNQNGMGTGILLRKSFEFNNVVLDPNGRISSLVINGINYINIYAFSGTNKKKERDELFLNNLTVHLSKSGIEYSVLAGDFNCILNSSDATGATKNVSAGLKRLVESLQWKDIFAEMKQNEFTFFRSGVASRLDRIYGPSRFVDLILEAKTISVPFSDHCAIVLKIKTDSNSFCLKGRGYWKINNSLLFDENISHKLSVEYQSICNRSSYFNDKNQWWNSIAKVKFKQFFKGESWAINKYILDRKSYFHGVLNDLHRRRCLGEEVSKDMFLVKSRLMEIELDRLKHYSNKLNNFSLLQGEVMNIFQVSAQIKKFSTSNNLKLKDGNVITGDCSIMKQIIFDHFSEQFKKSPDNALDGITDPLESVTSRLSDEQQRELTRPITVDEMFTVLKLCAHKKSPGPDGLNYEFYLKHFDLIKDDLVVLFNEYLSGTKKPPRDFTAGIITLIHKGNDKNDLNNYRPISLLNCDYKLFTKIIAMRIKLHLDDLLGCEQSACKSNRSCSDNLKDIRRIMLRANDSKRFKGALVSIDLQKAFDKVDHTYLWKVLEKFNFPDSLISCIRNLYDSATSKVLFNGFLTNNIKIESSVRQGCPLSMILFVLYIEPLLRKISDGIAGVLIYDKFIKTIAYADDINIFIRNDEEFDLLIQILNSFESFGKIKMNFNKSVYLRINRAIFGPQMIREVNSFKILGIYFSNSISESINLNYDKVILNVKHTLHLHGVRKLNLVERGWLLNAFILSKFWYLAQIFPPYKKHIDIINSLVGQFLWNGFIFKTARDQLYLDYDAGGIRLVNAEFKMKALFIRNILYPGGNVSENYILVYSKQHQLPLCFRQWIEVARLCKNDSLLDSSKAFYKHFLNQENFIPKVKVDFPQFQWTIIWKNLNFNFIGSDEKSRLFAFLNNLIPNKEKLMAYNIGRLSNNLCDICNGIDNNGHRIMECPQSRIISNWTKNKVEKISGIKLVNLEDILSFEIDENKKSEIAALWLCILAISFNLKCYPGPSLFVFKKEIREMRWNNRLIFNKVFGTHLLRLGM